MKKKVTIILLLILSLYLNAFAQENIEIAQDDDAKALSQISKSFLQNIIS